MGSAFDVLGGRACGREVWSLGGAGSSLKESTTLRVQMPRIAVPFPRGGCAPDPRIGGEACAEQEGRVSSLGALVAVMFAPRLARALSAWPYGAPRVSKRGLLEG